MKEAAKLIEHNGYLGFSMRALTGALDIKAASLYNHIDSIDALLVDVCAYAIQMQREACLANLVDGL